MRSEGRDDEQAEAQAEGSEVKGKSSVLRESLCISLHPGVHSRLIDWAAVRRIPKSHAVEAALRHYFMLDAAARRRMEEEYFGKG